MRRMRIILFVAESHIREHGSDQLAQFRGVFMFLFAILVSLIVKIFFHTI
jgi:hypothetical protein